MGRCSTEGLRVDAFSGCAFRWQLGTLLTTRYCSGGSSPRWRLDVTRGCNTHWAAGLLGPWIAPVYAV